MSDASVTLVVDYDGADDLLGDFADNLSSGAAFVATNRKLPIGERVNLVLSFPGLMRPIAIEGCVRSTRHDRPDGCGVGIELDARARAQLAAFVERIRTRDPELVSSPVRILLVDDNRHLATLLEGGLRSKPRGSDNAGAFVFQVAEDGRAAVELLEREAFDAVIVDIYMPILDGIQVISQARNRLGLTDLPIIAVSAGGDAARSSALKAGANVFLEKPVRLREVRETMQRLLAGDARRTMDPQSARG